MQAICPTQVFLPFSALCWERKLQTCCNFNSLTKNRVHILRKNMSNVRQLQIKMGKIHIDWNEKYEKLITAALHSKAKIMQTLIFFISVSQWRKTRGFSDVHPKETERPLAATRLLYVYLDTYQSSHPHVTSGTLMCEVFQSSLTRCTVAGNTKETKAQ